MIGTALSMISLTLVSSRLEDPQIEEPEGRDQWRDGMEGLGVIEDGTDNTLTQQHDAISWNNDEGSACQTKL
jgi:hypothetical protein